MSTDTKRQTKVPVALPRSEHESTPGMVPRDAIFKAVIGARIRVTTSGPEPSTIEGTIFTSDPITNFLALHISPPSTSTAVKDSSPLQPGTYRLLNISTITSFQLLSLSTSDPSPLSTMHLDPTTLDTAALQTRLKTTLANQAKFESRRGPPGTTAYAQALFDALARQNPMSWIPATGSMIFSDEYIVEKPYGVENVRPVSADRGSAAGLDRVRKVVRMEKDKLELRWSAREIEGKMGSGRDGKAAGTGGSPRKGG